jgi:hypothetical protein
MRQKTELHHLHYDGLRFIGITHGGEEIPCVVRHNPSGWGVVLDERDESRAWEKLAGWKPRPMILDLTPQCTGG